MKKIFGIFLMMILLYPHIQISMDTWTIEWMAERGQTYQPSVHYWAENDWCENAKEIIKNETFHSVTKKQKTLEALMEFDLLRVCGLKEDQMPRFLIEGLKVHRELQQLFMGMEQKNQQDKKYRQEQLRYIQVAQQKRLKMEKDSKNAHCKTYQKNREICRKSTLWGNR